MDSDSRGGGQTGLYAIVVQRHLVASRRGFLRGVREAAAVAAVRVVRRAGVKSQRSRGRHQEDVAQVGVSSAAEVGVAEPDDRRVRIAVAGAIFIDTRLVFAVHIVRDGVRVRTKLDSAERHARPRKSVSHSVGADERIYITCLGGRLLRGCPDAEKQEQSCVKQFKFHRSNIRKTIVFC